MGRERRSPVQRVGELSPESTPFRGTSTAFSIPGQGETRTAWWLSDRLSLRLTTYDSRLRRYVPPPMSPSARHLSKMAVISVSASATESSGGLLPGGGAGHHVRQGRQGEDLADRRIGRAGMAEVGRPVVRGLSTSTICPPAPTCTGRCRASFPDRAPSRARPGSCRARSARRRRRSCRPDGRGTPWRCPGYCEWLGIIEMKTACPCASAPSSPAGPNSGVRKKMSARNLRLVLLRRAVGGDRVEDVGSAAGDEELVIAGRVPAEDLRRHRVLVRARSCTRRLRSSPAN